MKNNNININITTESPAKNTQVKSADNPTRHSPETKRVADNTRIMRAAGLALGKRAIMDYTSRAGDRTGQRARQQNINNAMQVGNVAVNLLIGFKVGGVAGLGVAAAYSGYQSITANLDIQREREENEMRRDYYRSYAIMANRSNRSGGSL